MIGLFPGLRVAYGREINLYGQGLVEGRIP